MPKGQYDRTPLRADMRPGLRNVQPPSDRLTLAPDDEGMFGLESVEVPEGMDYNVKRMSIVGQTDTASQIRIARGHWTPVLTERHPHMMPSGTDPKTPITIGSDSMLYERPAYLSEERLERNKRLAEENISSKQVETRVLDDVSREGRAAIRPRLSRSIEPEG